AAVLLPFPAPVLVPVPGIVALAACGEVEVGVADRPAQSLPGFGLDVAWVGRRGRRWVLFVAADGGGQAERGDAQQGDAGKQTQQHGTDSFPRRGWANRGADDLNAVLNGSVKGEQARTHFLRCAGGKTYSDRRVLVGTSGSLVPERARTSEPL